MRELVAALTPKVETCKAELRAQVQAEAEQRRVRADEKRRRAQDEANERRARAEAEAEARVRAADRQRALMAEFEAQRFEYLQVGRAAQRGRPAAEAPANAAPLSLAEVAPEGVEKDDALADFYGFTESASSP